MMNTKTQLETQQERLVDKLKHQHVEEALNGKKERDANISSESQYSIQDLNDQLNKLKYSDDSPSLRATIQTLERQKSELARDDFYDYVSKEYGYTQQGTSFAREADFSVDDSGRVKVKYRGKTAWLTKQNRMDFYPLDSIASQIKGTDPKASEFIRVGLGIKDYKRGSSVKLQRIAEKLSSSFRDILKLGETPTGRPDGKIVLKKLQLSLEESNKLTGDLKKKSQ